MDNKPYQNDEIDLRDYIEVIKKGWKVISFVVAACIIIATAINFFSAKVYEVSSTINIHTPAAISAEQVYQKLLTNKTLDSIIEKFQLDLQESELANMIKTEEIRNTTLIKLKIRYSNPQLAVKACNAVSEYLILEQKAIQDKKLKLLNEQIEILEEKRQLVKGKIAKTTDASSNQQSELLFNYENLLFNIEAQVYLLKQEQTQTQLKEPEVLQQAVFPQSHIKPNRTLNLSIAAIMGLMLGILTVFIRNFWINE